jgi:hypothetical protein
VGKREIVGLSAEKVPRIQCDGQLVTTLPWAIKGRRKSWKRGRQFQGGRSAAGIGSEASPRTAGRTQEAAFVPRDARVLPTNPYPAADGKSGFAGPTVGANRVVTNLTICINCNNKVSSSVHPSGHPRFSRLDDYSCARRASRLIVRSDLIGGLVDRRLYDRATRKAV